MTAQTKTQQGFTLIELLVVIGILAILLAITLIAINPARQFGLADDTRRHSDVAAILNAIGEYQADPSNSGQLPAAITALPASTSAEIDSAHFGAGGSGPSWYGDLCDALLPTFISALPQDPSFNGGAQIPQSSCSSFDTHYTIEKDANNRITITAPNTSSYTSPTISATR